MGGWNQRIKCVPYGNRYCIHKCSIEDYKSDKKYDLIIAEGFVHALPNAQEIIENLKKYSGSGSIIVVTTQDEAGLFIEMMKRLFGVLMTRDCVDFNSKVDKLTGLFAPQLRTLKYMSKTPESWVKESLLSPFEINGNYVRMTDVIDHFGNDYYVIGSSPRLFTDYSWHKDIDFDSGNAFKEQYYRKRLSLIVAGDDEIIVEKDKCKRVCDLFREILGYAAMYEKTDKEEYLDSIERGLFGIKEHKDILSDHFAAILDQMTEAYIEVRKGEVRMDKYPDFFSAFGMAMNYIAFERK